MKQLYQTPQLNLIDCSTADILTLSGVTSIQGFDDALKTKYDDLGWNRY